jgi:hypothetical protein
MAYHAPRLGHIIVILPPPTYTYSPAPTRFNTIEGVNMHNRSQYGYQDMEQMKTTRTVRPTRSFRASIRKIFKGNANQAPQQIKQAYHQPPRYRDERRYQHTPVHAALSFIASTSTATMVDIEALDLYEPYWAEKARMDGKETEWNRKRRSGM